MTFYWFYYDPTMTLLWPYHDPTMTPTMTLEWPYSLRQQNISNEMFQNLGSKFEIKKENNSSHISSEFEIIWKTILGGEARSDRNWKKKICSKSYRSSKLLQKQIHRRPYEYRNWNKKDLADSTSKNSNSKCFAVCESSAPLMTLWWPNIDCMITL